MKAKIKFITLTCEKYHNTRVESIRKTWGQNQDVYFLSDFNIDSDIIGFDYLPKGYENVWMKYVEFIKTNSNFDHDWYFFTDDDTYVNINNINKLLTKFNSSNSICIGHVGELNPDARDMDGNFTGFPIHTIIGKDTSLPLVYVSGGAGFILSNEAMRMICQYIKDIKTFDIPRSYNGDVTFGFWIRNSGIEIRDVHGFWWTNPKDLNHSKDDVRDSYTYHYIDHEEMLNLHRNLSLKKVQNCIITQSKDQSKRLKDWILYHFEQGFDTFVYFDDFSEDNSISILEDLKNKYDLNIIIGYSDGIGNKKTIEEMQNSNSYGGDTSINYRIIRSYNKGLDIIRELNPDAVCVFIDVDEFLVSDSNKKVTDVINEHLRDNKSDLIYIHSFDIEDNYELEDWYTTSDSSCLRWDYQSRANTIFKNRGKSACIANSIQEILQLPNFVHQLRNYKDDESKIINYSDYANLRIHHFRKPNLSNSEIHYVQDYSLINKSKKVRDKYEKI